MDKRDCEHLLNALSDYIEGEAAGDLCIEIERHLEVCADCRALLSTLRKTISLYRELPQPEMPAGTRDRLHATLGLSDGLMSN
jgi:predicted anti-sigma-YlaC factor YlaD